jgi:flavin-dependent dehydrogenase
MERRVDAVIAGGGPAGAIIALRLARMGRIAIVIERGKRNRDKTCGHCLNPRALEILKRHGLAQSVQAIAAGATRCLRLHQRGQSMQTSLAEPAAEGVLVERHRFDQLLLDQAAVSGAEIIQPATARVRRLAAEDSVVDIVQRGRCICSVRAAIIIGADGLGSAIARAAGLIEPARIGRTFGFSFDITSDAAVEFPCESIQMFIGCGGYLGVVRQGESVLHVAGLVRDDATNGSRDPFAFTRSLAMEHQLLQRTGMVRMTRSDVARFTAAGPMPWLPTRPANASAALIGDAAGYIEPFTGEGMCWALQSAETLGDVLEEAGANFWNNAAVQRYCMDWKTEVGRRQRVCRSLAFALKRPRVSGLLLRASHRLPRLTRRLVAQVVTP